MTKFNSIRLLITLAVSALLASPVTHAAISGVTGTTFNMSASEGYISVADGGSIYTWGYSVDGLAMQLPGPTLIVTEGDTVTINLTNHLPKAAGNVSMVFMGQQVTATGGVSGALTNEAQNGGSVTYTFTPSGPGTYQYHSGTRSDLQVEMGLYGALIVRPDATQSGAVTCPDSMTPGVIQQPAYNHLGSCYDREYLFQTSSIDYQLHVAVEAQSKGPGPIVLTDDAFDSSEYWLLNGRVGPDTMAGNGTGLLPHQPYGSLARMHPGEKVLIRLIGAGRENHPFHTHGNHSRVLARDGNMLLTDTGSLAGPTLYTLLTVPGSTTDSIFEWTGKDLGWDMYGHSETDGLICNDTDGDGYNDYVGEINSAPAHEYCADHNKAIPVTLPSFNSLAFGGFYSGSPYLGDLALLAPGEGGLNPNAGFSYMWHSHTERELVNNDVFPGGLMTMMIVEAPYVDINPDEY
jgi:hypothetical protein